MNHDPLCPNLTSVHDCWIPTGSTCVHDCECRLITRVREDERQKAHNVIDRFDMYIGDRDAMHAWIDGTPPDWWTDMSND